MGTGQYLAGYWPIPRLVVSPRPGKGQWIGWDKGYYYYYDDDYYDYYHYNYYYCYQYYNSTATTTYYCHY